MATRHACQNAISMRCSRGSGRGPVKCSYCGSPLGRQEGVYGVFTWTSEGRYPREVAHKTFQTARAAQKHAGESSHVVRWVKVDS